MDRIRNILFVEDEQTLRLSMARGLSKLPGVKVADAATVREAKSLIATTRPELVISDLDLPDGSGIEVVAELDRLGIRVPIVFVSAYLGRFRHRLPTRGDVEVYEKPVGLDKLRAVVEDKLGLVDAAPISPFGVSDYVQLAGMGRHSVVIEVRSVGGHGRLHVNSGELWSAEDSLGTGIDAFRRLVLLGAAQVSCRTLRKNELPTRDIGRSAESALLEVARTYDEAERDAARSATANDDGWGDVFVEAPAVKASTRPPRAGRTIQAGTLRPPPPRAPSVVRGPVRDVPPPPPIPSLKSTGRAFDEAFERGVDALLAKDYPRALAAFTEASRISPNDRHVVANLERLRSMGFA